MADKKRRTVEVDAHVGDVTIDVGDVTVDVNIGEFDTQALVDELKERGVSVGDGSLRRILWEHDVLGVPLADVVDDMMREQGLQRGSATAALALEDE